MVIVAFSVNGRGTLDYCSSFWMGVLELCVNK